ncbi:MAG: MBL fold metallo-hydrolase [Vicinamibacterales bacterium]
MTTLLRARARELAWISCAVVVAGGTACRRTPPEVALVDRVAAALGGKDRILATNSVMIGGAGENGNLGQNRTPTGELPVYETSDVKWRIDFTQARSRLEQVRTPKFLTGNPSPARQFSAVDGEVAFSVTGEGVLTRQPPYVARERRAQGRHVPVGIMRLALVPNPKLSNLRSEGGHELLDVTDVDGTVLTLVVDPSTNLPLGVRSTTYHPNLGDVVLETTFAKYAAIECVQWPGQYTTTLDGLPVARLEASTTTPNADVTDLVAPPPVAMESGAPPKPVVQVDEVAPGVWYLSGQSHNSLAVEFADHLTLLEAPLSESRTLAVIEKARGLRPGKPLADVVLTHHHFDHSAGIRAAVAQGLVVRVPSATRAFYENLVGRRHTLVPDALATAPVAMTLEAFDGDLELRDASRTLLVFPLAGNAHADPLLVAYLPKERLLFEADAYSPPAPDAKTMPPFPFAANLLQQVEARALKVDRLLPAHGRPVPFTDLGAAVKSSAGSAR